ncbi:MAG: YbgA family protein [Solibacillus sp.]
MTKRQTEFLWREEKYRVMFYSQRHYNLIRQAMRDQMPHEEIKQLITEALTCTPTSGSMQNACQHMWGYFKKFATAKEKQHFLQLQEARNFQQVLHFLKKLADDYEVTYLIESRLLSNC